MWVSIGLFLISSNQEFTAETEHLFFLMVVFFMTITFSLILKVYLTIQNEELNHKILIDNYQQLLYTEKTKIEKERFKEVRFIKKQQDLINDIFEVKNQYISLKLILNSLKN